MSSAQAFADQVRTCDAFFEGCKHLDSAVQATHASSIVKSLQAQVKQLTGLTLTDATSIVTSINEASFVCATDKASLSATVSERVQGIYLFLYAYVLLVFAIMFIFSLYFVHF